MFEYAKNHLLQNMTNSMGNQGVQQRNRFGWHDRPINTHMVNQPGQNFGNMGGFDQFKREQGFQGNFGLANRMGNPWMAGFDDWRNRGFGREQLIQNILASMRGRNVQI